MQPANKALNQHTPAPWRADPAWSAATTVCDSAPKSRRLFLTGAKVVTKSLVAGTNTLATITQAKATPRSDKQPPRHHPRAVVYRARMVHSDGQSRLVKQQERLFVLSKKNIRFVAEMYHASYDSIAKTTSRSVTQPAPRRRAKLTAIAIERSPVSNLPHQPPHQRRPAS